MSLRSFLTWTETALSPTNNNWIVEKFLWLSKSLIIWNWHGFMYVANIWYSSKFVWSSIYFLEAYKNIYYKCNNKKKTEIPSDTTKSFEIPLKQNNNHHHQVNCITSWNTDFLWPWIAEPSCVTEYCGEDKETLDEDEAIENNGIGSY